MPYNKIQAIAILVIDLANKSKTTNFSVTDFKYAVQKYFTSAWEKFKSKS